MKEQLFFAEFKLIIFQAKHSLRELSPALKEYFYPF